MMLIALLLIPFLSFTAAENGLAAWLRYAPLENSLNFESSLPSIIVALNATVSSPVYTAGIELQKGILGIFGKQTTLDHTKQAASSSLIVGTVAEYTKAYGVLKSPPNLVEDGLWRDTESSPIQILALNERGAMYGAFEYLSMLAHAIFVRICSPAARLEQARRLVDDVSLEWYYLNPRDARRKRHVTLRLRQTPKLQFAERWVRAGVSASKLG